MLLVLPLLGEPLRGNVLLAYFDYCYLARPRLRRYLLVLGGALGLALKVELARAYSPLVAPLA